ncbi:MAG: hypothetical protein EHM93_14545 [Bacteroidales bacterium]|nr:MAG: hypothetical protein EHM93_14545 [Bacteroidales bacterium]
MLKGRSNRPIILSGYASFLNNFHYLRFGFFEKQLPLLEVYPAASGNPYLQRFLSPDNFVQSPFNAQNYNRYAYCLPARP